MRTTLPLTLLATTAALVCPIGAARADEAEDAVKAADAAAKAALAADKAAQDARAAAAQKTEDADKAAAAAQAAIAEREKAAADARKRGVNPAFDPAYRKAAERAQALLGKAAAANDALQKALSDLLAAEDARGRAFQAALHAINRAQAEIQRLANKPVQQRRLQDQLNRIRRSVGL